MRGNAWRKTVAVIGAGYMGGGIAQTLALAGFRVRIVDVDADLPGSP